MDPYLAHDTMYQFMKACSSLGDCLGENPREAYITAAVVLQGAWYYFTSNKNLPKHNALEKEFDY